MKKPKHPMQPICRDKDGILRFKTNAIVKFLLAAGPYDMNKLALMPFENEDRSQFAQLIGYSVAGFCDLPYVSDEEYNRIRMRQGFAGVPKKGAKAI